MADCDNSTLSLDNLKPIVHKVKPLHREASAWHPWTEAPPSFSHISATQDMQDGADSVSSLLGFSDTPEIFFPLHKGSSGLNVLPSTNNSSYYYDSDKEEIETRDSINSAGQYDDLLGSDYCKDVSQSGSDHVAINQRCWFLDHSESPPQWGRRSLFKVQMLNNEGESSTKDDQSGSGSQTASRPQTFLSQVTMATVRPPLQLPRTTVSQAALPFSPTLCFATPLLPLGSSAPSSRPPQQAAHAGMQDKGTKRVFVPPMTPQPLHVEGSSGSGILRPVSEIPAKFRTVFSEFPFFNYVQSKALDDILYTGKNFVACAPTGSGKTVLFELAIIRLLMKSSEPWREVKAVYMAPIKALCSQCFESWNKKFGPLGLNCKELTGDTEVDDFFDIQDSHIILTTPEKWDSMTRKWKDNSILQLVQLFLIDEVHVVKDATRGATLEVVVSRMKAVNAYRMSLNAETGFSMRFVAVSATIPNITDIADWLSDESGAAKYLDMDESHRPVKLRRVVLGFPCNPKQTEFKFDLSLNYKMANIIQTYSEQKPTLVFCSTRKGVQQSAAVLAKDARFIMSIEHKQRLMKYANSLLDSKLGELVMLGIGYHHAGVDLSDRKLIEKAFTQADLLVLFTTRTLAMGVNLPAHLVVIKSTMQYVGGSCEEYSEADVLQMMGRAGRPQFDTSATAVIMTKIQTRDKYIKLMNGMEIIESSLHSHLVEHLNAEIVLQTISDVNMALDWIRSTFLYIRALKNPTHYGFSAELDRYGIEAKLQELCLKNLNSLSSIGLITMDEDINIKPTDAGRLMARYCVAFDTMKQFTKVVGTENLSDLVELVSKSSEFNDIQLRVNEKRSLNTLNRDKYRVTIRFPVEGKIKTTEMKVNCLIQAQLGCIPIQEFGLNQDTAKIFRNGMRISRCLSEFLGQPSKNVFSALLNSLILAKCFKARIWENSIYVSKQLVKIGQSLASVMVNAGLTSFSKIEQTNPREIELILNRHPPFGNQIRDSVIHLPKYEVTLEQLSKYSCETAEVVVKVNLKNQTQLLTRRTAHNQHYASLLIGNSDNTVVFLQKLTDVMLLKCGSWSKKIEVAKASRGEAISVNLISSEYVGLDIQQKFNVYYSGAKKYATDNSYYLTHDRTGQTLQQSKLQAASQKENDTSAAEQDPGSTRQCNHYCKNKDLCGHDCCKVGVNVTRKTSLNQGSPFSSYLRDLRNRTDALTHTPVKRLKMKMSEESASNMQQFIFKPKERLPAFPMSEGIDYDAPVRPSVVDLTTEDWTAVPDVVDLDVYNDDDNVEDVCLMTEELVKKADASHASHQSMVASVWTNSCTRAGVDQDYKMHPDQINTNSSVHVKTSKTSASNWKSHCKKPPPSHIPTITFDLGNDWDDWSDFDDENLVRASEKSPLSCAANVEPQDQQPIDCNTSAFATSASAICHPQVQPAFVTARTPLRSIPPTLNPGIKQTESSLVTVRTQNRITLDWNKKRSSTFNDAIAVKTPENIPPQAETSVAPHYRRFDFFSRGPAANSSSPINTCNSDEKVPFRGIFEGLI